MKMSSRDDSVSIVPSRVSSRCCSSHVILLIYLWSSLHAFTLYPTLLLPPPISLLFYCSFIHILIILSNYGPTAIHFQASTHHTLPWASILYFKKWNLTIQLLFWQWKTTVGFICPQAGRLAWSALWRETPHRQLCRHCTRPFCGRIRFFHQWNEASTSSSSTFVPVSCYTRFVGLLWVINFRLNLCETLNWLSTIQFQDDKKVQTSMFTN